MPEFMIPTMCVMALHGVVAAVDPPMAPAGVRAIRPEALAALRDDAVALSQRASGGVLRVPGISVPMGDSGEVVGELLLAAKPIAAPDLRLEIAGGAGVRQIAAPALRCYSGSFDGVVGSEVWIAVWNDPDAAHRPEADDSFVYGFIRLPDGLRLISSPPRGARGRAALPTVVFEPARAFSQRGGEPAAPFCGAGELGVKLGGELGDATDAVPPAEGGVADLDTCRTLSVAVDTDTAFTSVRFDGDSAAAAAYAMALISAVSEIAERDASTKLILRYLRLRDPNAPVVPPISVFSLTSDWRANMGHVPRDFVHSLSGGGSSSGEAYLGALCGSTAYGSSRGLTGSFPYPLADFDPGNFDLFLVGHEIGHTLGAPHTFQSNPVFETCGDSGCPAGATGSLMSYCALCPGGAANIALRYHPISVGYVKSTYAALPCDYTGGDTIIARDDVARGIAEQPLEHFVLLNDRGAGCGEVSLAQVDAKTVLGCDVQSFVAADGRGALRVTPLPGVFGSDSVGYGIVDADGATAQARLHIEWMQLLAATTVIGASPMIEVAAYDTGVVTALPDLDAMTPFLKDRVVTPIFNSGTAAAVPPTTLYDHVALRYDGWIQVPERDLWRFALISDAGSRLWIDGVLVVDHDGVHLATRKEGFVALEAGRHRVRVEYFEDTGAASLSVRWGRLGGGEVQVPTSAWSRGGVVAGPDIDRDGVVDARDVAAVLSAWGACQECAADLDGSGQVDARDLVAVLGAWTG